jgi:histidine triad (HIT) family protein
VECVFCDIVAGRNATTAGLHWPDAVAFTPLDPVTPGHTLVIPKVHVPDAGADPEVSKAVMGRAAEVARLFDSYNIITSSGAPATQSVRHLHLHIVPRYLGDGLPLPWTPQQQGHT